MKKVLTILLCFVLVLAVFPSFNVFADTITDLSGTTWRFTNFVTASYSEGDRSLSTQVTVNGIRYDFTRFSYYGSQGKLRFTTSSSFPYVELSNTEFVLWQSSSNYVLLTSLDVKVIGGYYATNANIISIFQLTAVQIIPKNVRYSLNGGSLPSGISNPTIVTDSKLPSVLPIPTKSGYQFIGWYYDSQFQNQAHASDSITGDVTLYVLWYEPPINKLTRIGGSILVMLGGVVTALASNSFSSLLPLFLIGIAISLLFLAFKLIRKVIKK